MQRQDSDLAKIINQLQQALAQGITSCNILQQINEKDLLSQVIQKHPYNCKVTETNLLRMLNLLTKLAADPGTPRDQLIELLTKYIDSNRKMMPGNFISGTMSDQVTEKYLQVLDALSKRHDVGEQDLVKLLKHTYQVNEKCDSSLLYDMASKSKDNTKAYLQLLVDLLKCGKLSSQTIWDILRPPFGKDENIVATIAREYYSSDCIILLLELIRKLEPNQIKYLMPDNMRKFCKHHVKEDLVRHIKSLPLEEAIKQLHYALDENDPLGFIMYLPRDAGECNVTKGTLKEITYLLGVAVSVQKKYYGTLSHPDSQPLPSAPSLAELEKGRLTPEPIHRRDRVTTGRLLGRDLRNAVAENNEKKVKELVNLGADVNYHDDNCDKLGDTSPLLLSILGNNINIARILLQHGANINYQRSDSTTLLTAAVYYGRTDTAKLLLEHGADSLAITRNNNSALSFAAAAGNIEMVKALCNDMLNKIQGEHNRENGKTIEFLKSQFKACLTSKTTRGPVALILMQFLENIQKSGVPDHVIKELLPNKFSFKNSNIEKELVTEIIKLPFCERIKVCENIIDRKTPLAEIFWMDHGLLSLTRHIKSGYLGAINNICKEMIGDIHHHFWILMKKDSFSEADQHDLKDLLDNGANINAYEKGSSTPLCHAAQLAPVEKVQFLLKNGADPTLPLKIERSDLASIIQGYAPRIKNNFIHYLETQQAQQLAILPETIAELYGHDDSARLIREKRLSLQAVSGKSTEADLIKSIEAGDADNVARILKDHPGTFNECFSTLISTRTTSQEFKKLLQVIDHLLSRDDITVKEIGNFIPTKNTLQLKNFKELLLEHIATQPADKRYKLHGEILYNQDHPYYKLFNLKRGLFQFHHSISDLLLFHRVKKYRQQADAIWVASFEGDNKRLNSLLNGGVDVNFTKGALSTSPLYVATQNWNTRCIKALLKAGADVNQPTRDGATPLFIAAQNGYEDILQILLDHHADINATFKTDQASLLRFANSYSPEKNKRVLAKVIDFLRNQPNKNSILMTAIDIANIMERPKIVALLQQYSQATAPTAVVTEAATPSAPPPSYQSLYPDLYALKTGSQPVTATVPAARPAVEMEPVQQPTIQNDVFGLFAEPKPAAIKTKNKYEDQLAGIDFSDVFGLFAETKPAENKYEKALADIDFWLFAPQSSPSDPAPAEQPETEDKRDARIETMLDALPNAPTGSETNEKKSVESKQRKTALPG